MEQRLRGIKGLEVPRFANGRPKYDNRTMLPEVWRPRYCARGAKPRMADCVCRGILPRHNRANEYSPDLLFSLQGQEHIALPRRDLVRQPGLPRHSHAGVQKSALFSFLLRLLRDWRRSRSTCMGCPPHLPMTSGVNGYSSQPTGRGCACLVGVTVRDPAPPVTQDVGALYLGTVFCVYTVPRHRVLEVSSTV